MISPMSILIVFPSVAIAREGVNDAINSVAVHKNIPRLYFLLWTSCTSIHVTLIIAKPQCDIMVGFRCTWIPFLRTSLWGRFETLAPDPKLTFLTATLGSKADIH